MSAELEARIATLETQAGVDKANITTLRADVKRLHDALGNHVTRIQALEARPVHGNAS